MPLKLSVSVGVRVPELSSGEALELRSGCMPERKSLSDWGEERGEEVTLRHARITFDCFHVPERTGAQAFPGSSQHARTALPARGGEGGGAPSPPREWPPRAGGGGAGARILAGGGARPMGARPGAPEAGR